jgi:Tfp pilus assembly protein PilF
MEEAPDQATVMPSAPMEEVPDQVRLREALTGREMSPGQVADLSDRLIATPGSLQDQEAMARLELVILKSLKNADKNSKATMLRNLGIVHFHQGKFKQARQELQSANELNPKSGLTHFYLARLFAHQAQIYDSQGKKRLARQQFKRASIELDVARKLEPSNSLYRKNVKELAQQNSDR